MTIDTRIYRRMVEEHSQAGINATACTMKETTRFGGLRESHIEGCAQERYDSELQKLQGKKIGRGAQ